MKEKCVRTLMWVKGHGQGPRFFFFVFVNPLYEIKDMPFTAFPCVYIRKTTIKAMDRAVDFALFLLYSSSLFVEEAGNPSLGSARVPVLDDLLKVGLTFFCLSVVLYIERKEKLEKKKIDGSGPFTNSTEASKRTKKKQTLTARP